MKIMRAVGTHPANSQMSKLLVGKVISSRTSEVLIRQSSKLSRFLRCSILLGNGLLGKTMVEAVLFALALPESCPKRSGLLTVFLFHVALTTQLKTRIPQLRPLGGIKFNMHDFCLPQLHERYRGPPALERTSVAHTSKQPLQSILRFRNGTAETCFRSQRVGNHLGSGDLLQWMPSLGFHRFDFVRMRRMEQLSNI
jgi:hypothetical protein